MLNGFSTFALFGFVALCLGVLAALNHCLIVVWFLPREDYPNLGMVVAMGMGLFEIAAIAYVRALLIWRRVRSQETSADTDEQDSPNEN